jgi:hypothetical protein
MIGVESFISPFARDAAAPKGAPRRLELPDFFETVLAPRGALRRGALISMLNITDFHGSGVNQMRSCPFLQSGKIPVHRTHNTVLVRFFRNGQKITTLQNTHNVSRARATNARSRPG